MIHAEKEKIIIGGYGPAICLEVENILKAFRKSVEEKIGKEEAEKLLDEIVDNSKKSDEQIIKESKMQAENVFKNILKSVMEGLGE